MADKGNDRVHALVEGRVQGVGFRGFVLEKAYRLGVNGWVRNRWNGTVECVAEGPRVQLEALLEALRTGPPMAHVENVSIEWGKASGEFIQFFVRSSG